MCSHYGSDWCDQYEEDQATINPPETGFLPCWPRGNRLRRAMREGICEPGESAEDYGRRMRAVVHELGSVGEVVSQEEKRRIEICQQYGEEIAGMTPMDR